MIIRSFHPGDEKPLSHLVGNVFMRYIASGYSREGVNEFIEYVNETKILERLIDGYHHIMIASKGRNIIGMIEIREFRHISLFFVDERYQRNGIGSMLMEKTLELCRVMNPILQRLSVNSSPFAVPVYTNLGFIAEGEEVEKNGIRFTPMSYTL
jgi:GNAT superfamily N-acetyltransferase